MSTKPDVRHKTRLLVVEDEKSIRLTLQAFLEGAGYPSAVAGDGREALHYLETHELDVIISDIVMPGMTGIELLESVRKKAPLAQVILMTGEPTLETAASAVRAGAFEYLTKPVSKAAILRSVANAARVKRLEDDRRRLEEENQRYQESLEQLVKERTGELEQALQDLTNAQQELVRHERLNALAQLAAGICHDFNNALVPILGFADQLAAYPEILDDKEECLQMLGYVREAANDAKEIVRRMREFYKPAEELETSPMDIEGLLNEVIALSRPRWETQTRNEGRTVEVTLDFEEGPIGAGNIPQLREAFMNLILNAADAMPEGGTITLSTRYQADEMVLELSDTGTGMTKEVCEHCFEPFYSTKGRSGTGMGLAMVHGIIHRHGGTIDIHSEVGKGTTFVIHLPLKQATSQVEEQPLVAPPPTSPLQVLVIDDEAWSRKLLARYLGNAGHIATLAENGADGLAKAADSAFDIAITDRAMPGMNGDQVATALKAIHPHMPILLLTGDIFHQDERVSDAIDLILEKPVTQGEFITSVHRLLASAPPE